MMGVTNRTYFYVTMVSNIGPYFTYEQTYCTESLGLLLYFFQQKRSLPYQSD